MGIIVPTLLGRKDHNTFTNAASSIYSPPIGFRAVITSLWLATTASQAPQEGFASLWLDNDGTTYDNTTKLGVIDVAQGAILKEPASDDGWLGVLDDPNGNLAASCHVSGVPGVTTVSVFGYELSTTAKGTEKTLAQLVVRSDTNVTLYSVPAGKTAIVKGLWLHEYGGGSPESSLHMDDDGTTYDDTNAFIQEYVVSKYSGSGLSEFFPLEITMDGRTKSPSIGISNVLPGTAAEQDQLTATLVGIEFDA